MVILVSLLDIIQDLDRFFNCSWFYDHFLESTLKSSILFDVLPVLIKGSRPNNLHLTSCQGRLEHVGRIQGTTCSTSTDDRMDLINEKNNIRILLDLLHYCFHALFKLTSVLSSSHK